MLKEAGNFLFLFPKNILKEIDKTDRIAIPVCLKLGIMKKQTNVIQAKVTKTALNISS